MKLEEIKQEVERIAQGNRNVFRELLPYLVRSLRETPDDILEKPKEIEKLMQDLNLPIDSHLIQRL